ncbi:MAG: alcohol dehydrogenase catalytic domain-containing protein [Desulfobacterales bacterium]|nr:alcohol dehydrogenase catalytic domain-containing protein [Desulfobacterales bacterium]
MKAVRFHNQTISMIDAPLPDISEHEALVKILMAGICATDVELLNGYQDFHGIPGHEFVGLVEKAPQAPELVGKRVAVDINIGCGQCLKCRTGDTRHCPSRRVVGIRGKDGGFAEYCALPVANLSVLPERLETIDAVFAEPLAAALEIAQQVHIRHDTKMAVMGDGKMGLLCAFALNRYTSNLTVLGRHADKLNMAASQGISIINTAEMDPETAAQRLKGFFELVVEATGNPDAINQAVQLVGPEGTVVVKTTSHQPSKMNLAAMVVNEITLIGSRCGDIGFAVKSLANQWVNVAPLVDTVYPFAEFEKAFEHAMQPGSRKILVAFE